MADFRTIMPTIWSDRFIESLPISEKLLFIYLFANERTSNIGVTDVSPRKIAFDTGATVDDVEAFFAKAEKAGKIVRDGDMVLLVNFIKNQTHMREDSKVSKFLVKNLQKLHGELPSGHVKTALAAKYPQFFCCGETPSRRHPEDNDTHALPSAGGKDTASIPYSDGLDTPSIGSAGGKDTPVIGPAYRPREERGKTKEETGREEKKKEKNIYKNSSPMSAEDIEEARDAVQAERRRGDYEFNVLRSEYDRARPEGPMAGKPEFMALFHSQDWPGIDEILAGLNRLLEGDYQFIEKTYAPGLAKFIAQRMWKMAPRKPQPKQGQEPEPTDAEKAAKEKGDRILAELKAKEAQKRKIRGW